MPQAILPWPSACDPSPYHRRVPRDIQALVQLGRNDVRGRGDRECRSANSEVERGKCTGGVAGERKEAVKGAVVIGDCCFVCINDAEELVATDMHSVTSRRCVKEYRYYSQWNSDSEDTSVCSGGCRAQGYGPKAKCGDLNEDLDIRMSAATERKFV